MEESENKISAEIAEENAQVAGENAVAEAAIKPKRTFGEVMRNYFTATRMSYIAIFTALAFILRLPVFEFPIIPAVPFLKVDFSGTFVMIAGFALGPVAGVAVSVIKELLYALSFTQTVGVGELANILIMLPYILIPSIVYKRHKGIKSVLISLTVASVAQAVISVPVNYLLTFPFFLIAYAGAPDWATGMAFYLDVWYWAVLFNFVKTVLLTVAVLILYKPLSKLIKITNAKFNSLKGKKNKLKTQ